MQNKELMKKIIITVALVCIGIGGYVFVNKNSNEDSGKSTNTPLFITNESKDVNTSPKDVRFVGKWETGGNDFEYTTLMLMGDGSFTMRGYFLRNPDAPYTFTGSWNVFQKNGASYLSLLLDTPIAVPSTDEVIENYKSWGQEFVGTNEVNLKITTSNEEITFYFDGNLMVKTN